MNKYVITYLGGDQPTNPDEGRKSFAKYQQWLASLGEAVIEPMVPFRQVHTIAPDGSDSAGSSTAMSGHTIIQASSIEDAVAIAKACPFLETNGSLEVAEIVQMPG